MSAYERFRRAVNRAVPSSITDWNRKWIGTAAIILTAAVVAASLLLTSSVFGSNYTVKARFTNAVGLATGDQVLLAGVKVGSVSSIEVVGDHVEAGLRVRDGVQLPADSTAQIAVQSLLGVIGVNIVPGGNWAHLLGNGSQVKHTAVPYEYFEIQNSSGKLLSSTDAKALGRVVSSLSKATSGDRSEIDEVIDGLAEATRAIDEHRNGAARLIDAAEQLSGTLASKDSQLRAVVEDLDAVVRGLADHSGQLGQLIDQTEQVAAETSSLIGRNEPRLNELLADLHTALKVVGSHQVDLARSVAFAASAIKGFASVGKSGTASTPWANIYTDLVGAAAGYEVFGNCGALDSALDIALGPDPKPCDERSGPLPGGGSVSSSASSLVNPIAGNP